MSAHRRIHRTIAIIISILGLMVPAAGQPNLKKISVTMRFTGMSHLVGDEGATTRLLVVTNQHGIQHELFLLVNTAQNPTTQLLDQAGSRTINGTTENYNFRELPDGFEIDLKESGWVRPAVP